MSQRHRRVNGTVRTHLFEYVVAMIDDAGNQPFALLEGCSRAAWRLAQDHDDGAILMFGRELAWELSFMPS